MKQIITIICCFVLVSCSEKQAPNPKDLYEKYRNSVVLIKNEYFLKVSLDNGIELNFKQHGNKIIFFENEEEAYKNAAVSFGTGFIIDDQGKIATNRHVVYPEINKESIWIKIDAYMSDMQREIQSNIKKNQLEIEEVTDLYNNYYNELTYSETIALRDKHKDLINKNNELNQLLLITDYRQEKSSIDVINLSLGVVYDNTFIESNEDFDGCVRIKKSEDIDVDLAIIQLKSKRTPKHIIDYFDIGNIQTIPDLKMNDEVFMIGFNKGIGLANTEDGIKSQFTIGNISQDPSLKKIMYSIPTLPGSSGSPIMDKWGNLIAINFAKTFDYQGFSFGIPVNKLLALQMEDELNANNIAILEQKPKIKERKIEPLQEKSIIYSLLSQSSILNWKGRKPTGEHNGTVNISKGTISVYGDKIEKGEITFPMETIKVVDYGMNEEYKQKLENHLKGTVKGKERDFFNVTEYPYAYFLIKEVKLTSGINYLSGLLTIKGITNEVKAPVDINFDKDGGVLVIKSEAFQIDRTRWGVNYGSKSVFQGLKDYFIEDNIEVQFILKLKAEQFL
jgi:polyisoprenoid-binding protein YceI